MVSSVRYRRRLCLSHQTGSKVRAAPPTSITYYKITIFILNKWGGVARPHRHCPITAGQRSVNRQHRDHQGRWKWRESAWMRAAPESHLYSEDGSLEVSIT